MKKSEKVVLAGRVLSVVIMLPFFMGVVFGLTGNPQVVEGMNHFGWPSEMVPVIITLEAICSVLYLIPRTAFIGAILLTGYLGGAIATHLRIGENAVFIQVVLGILVWVCLLMRNPEYRKLLK